VKERRVEQNDVDQMADCFTKQEQNECCNFKTRGERRVIREEDQV